jgi:3-oxoadipate enol-lactonase
MKQIETNGTALHVAETGPADAPPVVFLHALGVDLRVWDGIVARMPPGLRLVRIDMRGHGLSDCPPAPYAMGALVTDTEGAMDALGLRDAVVVGLSIGGMIAQGLAVKRLDLVRGLVLSNTAARIGTPEIWAERMAAARDGGLAAMAEGTLERWFPEPFRSGPEAAVVRRLFERQPLEGWLGCAAAISGTDFYTPTSGLRLPTLAIAADRDGSTPPDLVRETAELIPGAQVQLIRGAGHLPCIDAPDAYAAALTGFLTRIGHAEGAA